MSQVFSNNQIPYIGDYVRIVCAICNAFRVPRVFDKSDDVTKAEAMKKQLAQKNDVKEFVETNGLVTRKVIWEPITQESLPDFPELSLKQLQELTFGVYQV